MTKGKFKNYKQVLKFGFAGGLNTIPKARLSSKFNFVCISHLYNKVTRLHVIV